MYGIFRKNDNCFEYVNEEIIAGLGDEKIGVEHLILGIIREGEGRSLKH